MRNDRIINILLMLTISFFAAFTVGLNKYAIKISNDISVNKLVILSEILIHGISGLLIGLMFTKFIDDIYILCAVSGAGGMIGQKLLYAVVKNFMNSIASLDIDKDIEKDE